MATAIAYRTGYTMDFASQLEFAQRDDGVWFMRSQEKTPRGYRWDAWKACAPSMDHTTEHPVPKAFRLPEPDGQSRAESAIEGRSNETCYTTPCYPLVKRSFGEFWLCLSNRSVLCAIVRKNASSTLISVDGREVWIAHKVLMTDEQMAHIDGREVMFATIATWATDTIAKLGL